MNRFLYLTASALLLLCCTYCRSARTARAATGPLPPDTVEWWDASRSRKIPLAFYPPQGQRQGGKQQWIIFSHGYGQNLGGDYLHYSYLCAFLAQQGCRVVSIQHELPTDSLLPTTGIPQQTRRTNWERGAQNILFVLQELKKQYPDLDYRQVVLIGHSNGGDMSALFAHRHPAMLGKLITLDNRRMLLPRGARPRVYSLRSSDQPADEGVLPTLQEQQQWHMTIIKLPATQHNDMDDDANTVQRNEINEYLKQFISEP